MTQIWHLNLPPKQMATPPSSPLCLSLSVPPPMLLWEVWGGGWVLTMAVTFASISKRAKHMLVHHHLICKKVHLTALRCDYVGGAVDNDKSSKQPCHT